MNFWVLLLILLAFPGPALAEDLANFIMEGESFSVRQQFVYNAGIFDAELTEDEMLRILYKKRFAFSEQHEMQYRKYSYMHDFEHSAWMVATE